MVELLTRLDTDIETRERLKEVEAENALSTIGTASRMLWQREMRLDAAYYSNEAIQAQQLLNEWDLGIESLDSLTDSVFYPTRFKQIHTQSRAHGVPFLTPSMMLHFRPESKTYLAKRQDQLEKCTVQRDWILITRSGSVGRCVIVGKHLSQFAVSDDAIRVRSKEMPVGYLYAYLMSWIGQALLTKDQYGATVKHLESHHVANIPVPVLPEAEMNEIAEGIQQAYDLREEANALLDDAMEMFYRELELPEFDEALVEYLPQPDSDSTPLMENGVLRSFTVSTTMLEGRLDASFHIPLAKSVVNVMQSGRYMPLSLSGMCQDVFLPNRFKRVYVNEEYGVPFIQGAHIPLMKPYDLQYITRRDELNISHCKISGNWVLVTRSGTVGRISVVPSTMEGWAASEHLIRIIAKTPDCNPGYIALFLMTPYGQHQMLSKIYGAVVDELTVDDLERVVIPNAPKDVQDAIGNKVIAAFENKEQANIIERDAIQRLEDRLQGSRA